MLLSSFLEDGPDKVRFQLKHMFTNLFCDPAHLGWSDSFNIKRNRPSI